MERGGYIYMLTSKNNSVIYIGVTSNLKARVNEHVTKINPSSFTAKYNCNKLIYYETFDCIDDAIAREKQLKAGSRKAKEQLIQSVNPNYRDLVEEIED